MHLVASSQHLVELDVSWQGVQAQTMVTLLSALRENRFLHSLSLGYNRLLIDPNEIYPDEGGGLGGASRAASNKAQSSNTFND